MRFFARRDDFPVLWGRQSCLQPPFRRLLVAAMLLGITLHQILRAARRFCRSCNLPAALVGRTSVCSRLQPAPWLRLCCSVGQTIGLSRLSGSRPIARDRPQNPMVRPTNQSVTSQPDRPFIFPAPPLAAEVRFFPRVPPFFSIRNRHAVRSAPASTSSSASASRMWVAPILPHPPATGTNRRG